MIIYIVAGGSGTRLWPLSTLNKPKHLLSLLNDKSLLVNTVQRVKRLTNKDKIFIISEQSHIQEVVEQVSSEIDKDHVFAEPARRGTASCVALAIADSEKRGHDADEPIFVLWADHVIRDAEGFSLAMKRASEVAKTNKKIVFVGATPTHPTTKFGYIKKGKEVSQWQDIYEHEGFVEKPNAQVAQQYFSSGEYLWNMGYLLATRNVLIEAMKTYSEDMLGRYKTLLEAEDIDEAYLGLENIALEYVFSEKIEGALVIQGTFDWADVGSFDDLHEMSAQDDNGNHARGNPVLLEDTTNSFVSNEIDTPVAIIGLDNIVVVNSPNGLLIANKNYSQKVGDVAKKLQS